MYLVQPDELHDQGDIIKKIEILAPSSNEPVCALEPKSARVIVLSHGCEIDKADSSTLLVAPVVRLSADDGGLIGLIRKGRVRNYFHLAPDGAMSEEAAVDWRLVQVVRKSPVTSNRSGQQYVCTLDADAKAAMAESLLQFLFRS